MHHEIELKAHQPLKVITLNRKEYGCPTDECVPPVYEDGAELEPGSYETHTVTYDQDMLIELNDHKVLTDDMDQVFEGIVGARPKGRHGG